MTYTATKVFITVVCSLFIALGASALVYTLQYEFHGLLLTCGLIFCVAGAGVMVSNLRQISSYQKMTLAWYRSTYPLNVEGSRVSCFACGNPHIHIRALMEKTYHHEHICTECGTTLYYSPETD